MVQKSEAAPGGRAEPVKVPPVRVVFEESDRRWILAQLDEVLSSGMIAAGRKVEQFEAFWAEYTRCPHAVAVANGGIALQAILAGLDVNGKDVLVPTNTFIATVNAVILAGGNPVFLDADPKTLCVSLAEIQRKSTPNTVGVIVVHVGGIISPEMPSIVAWCERQGVWLVEDAAHAHGSEWQGKRAGQFGKAAAYSFFATKVITSGEGGMIVTSDERLATFCRSYRDYGKKSAWESVHTSIGSNGRLSEITAVIGLRQSHRLDEFIAAREKVAQAYIRGLGDVLELVVPHDRCSWYKFTALLPHGVSRDDFKSGLKVRSISLAGGVYDLPVHLQPVFESRRLAGSLPLAEDVCARHVCLPIFYGMSDAQVEHVIGSVKELALKFRK